MEWIYAAKAKIRDEIKDMIPDERIKYFCEGAKAFIERARIRFRESVEKKDDY